MADYPQPASPKKNTSGANSSGKKVPCSAPAMASKTSKSTSAADMYWFAFAADPPAERPRRGLWAQQADELASPEQEIEGAKSPGSHKESPLDTYWFAHAGGGTPSEDAVHYGACSEKLQGDEEGADHNHHHQQQLSRDERLRMVKERQEEERARRLQEFEQHAQAAQQYREQQEEERRRRIEGLRQRDLERRQQVEERKRLIWEAEHERKEAVLRRSMDRDTKGEARRNANRMSSSFAFGSSTPRTFDLDLATMGASGSSILMSATNSRRSEERDFETNKKKATSSYNLCQAAEGSCEADSGLSPRTPHDGAFASPTAGGWLVGSGVTVGEDPMTRSMIVQGSQSSNIRARRKTDLMPVIPWSRGGTAPSRSRSSETSSCTPGTAKRAVSMSRLDALAQPRRRFTQSEAVPATTAPSMAAKSMLNLAPHPSSKKGNGTSKSMLHLGGAEPKLRQARSMCHLAVQPRQTRSSMLRTSKMSLPSAVAQGQREHQSPSRPRSSMSMASEQSVQSSQASTVSLRPRPAQRKPRPLSIAGTIPDRSLSSSRPTGGADKSGSSSPEKASRARSVTCVPPEVPPKPAHLRKPQKPQPPASSPSRREQRATPKSSRSQPNLVAKTGGEEQMPEAVPTVTERGKIEQLEGSASDTALQGSSEDQQRARESPVKSAAEDLAHPAEPSPSRDEARECEEGANAEPVREKEKSPLKEGTPAKDPEQVPAKEGTPVKERSVEPGPEEGTPLSRAPRVISEEEAKALLAEKRRLAREQAEREAELERQRQEELRRQEEERLRLEEEEQRRFEEEQIRLAEVFRKQEEEKLQRAIEEQAKREAEEQQRRELEAQQKAEREEQERRAKEEAEKQRKELEERLKREEAERAERKKRVEEIMSRTRRRGGAKDSPSPAQKSSSPESDAPSSREPEAAVTNGIESDAATLPGDAPSETPAENTLEKATLSTPPNEASENCADVEGDTAEESVSVMREQDEKVVGSVEIIEVLAPAAEGETEVQEDLIRVDASEQIVGVVDRSVSASESAKSATVENCEQVYSCAEEMVPMEQSPPSKPTSPVFGSEEVCHTNGYGHHVGVGDAVVNGVSCGKVSDLLGLDSLSSMVPLKTEATTNSSSSTAANHAVDNLINVDDINSNRVSANPLIAFEEDNRNTKPQESPQLTDLLLQLPGESS